MLAAAAITPGRRNPPMSHRCIRRILACCAVLNAGCGVHYGFVRDTATTHDIRYDVTHGFAYGRTVAGTASGGSILCLIPVADATYADAVKDMYKAAQLKPNEALVNLREDHTFRFYLLWCTNELLLSADVLEVGGKK
jgi:hypothetical protein